MERRRRRRPHHRTCVQQSVKIVCVSNIVKGMKTPYGHAYKQYVAVLR